jgi:hypothetical protein
MGQYLLVRLSSCRLSAASLELLLALLLITAVLTPADQLSKIPVGETEQLQALSGQLGAAPRAASQHCGAAVSGSGGVSILGQAPPAPASGRLLGLTSGFLEAFRQGKCHKMVDKGRLRLVEEPIGNVLISILI